jgi:hypothetical protein
MIPRLHSRLQPPSLGATIITRGMADALVEHLARFGIISEVIQVDRWFYVITETAVSRHRETKGSA